MHLGHSVLSISLLGVAFVACSSSTVMTCTVPSKYQSSNATADDSPAVASALARCSHNAVVIFSEGVDYNILTPISATNLSNVEIHLRGNLHLPKNITAVQAVSNSRNLSSSDFGCLGSPPYVSRIPRHLDTPFHSRLSPDYKAMLTPHSYRL